MKGAAVLLLVPGALAFQFPFEIPSFFKSKSAILGQNVVEETPVPVSRVAIIGAGAGGSSAAFWIAKAKERYGFDVEVDVYDRESYVGGRSTTIYPYDDTSLRAIEIGAQTFSTTNKNIWRAIEEFNLTRRDFQGEDYQTGIWDGQNFILSFGTGWGDTFKRFWRYGFTASQKTQSAAKSILDSYSTLYTRETPRWDKVEDLSASLGFDALVGSTTSQYLLSKGVPANYIAEVVEASTRAIYAQDPESIHALEGISSTGAGSNTAAVASGNSQVFARFLTESGAAVFMKTPVTSIQPKGHQWAVESARGTQTYKAVILAAPFHQAALSVPQSIADQIPVQPYVGLHVTVLSTTAPSLNASHFNLPEGHPVPQTILTTRTNATTGEEPEFYYLTYDGAIRDGEWAVKIFSKEPLSDEWLDAAFSGSVGWLHRKQWNAFPKFPPTATFPPVKLDHGFYYVNSFEPFLSTMEMATVSSRNVVDLVLNDLFKSGLCGSTITAAAASTDGDEVPPAKRHAEDPSFVYGWDC